MSLRKTFIALASSCALLAVTASPSMAIVGGHDTSNPAYGGVAEVSLGGLFGCTGTLIAPQWVLTAGHCGSLTGAAVATPISWPAPLITVRMGSNKAGQGTSYSVSSVTVPPSYLATQGYDISLLKLSAPVSGVPITKIAGPSGRALWNPGVMEKIVGWGVTQEDGDAPDTLQEASVPIIADATCAAQVDSYDASTMLCAGYPQGGTDTCQGDSGGPMFATDALGALKLVGATSFGNGCARPDNPGVYARVADSVLRTWIGSKAPEALDN